MSLPFTNVICEDSGFNATSYTEYRIYKCVMENSLIHDKKAGDVSEEDPAASGGGWSTGGTGQTFEFLDIDGLAKQIDDIEEETSVMAAAADKGSNNPKGPKIGYMQTASNKGKPLVNTEGLGAEGPGKSGSGGKESAIQTVKKDLRKVGGKIAKKIGFDVNKNAIQNMKKMSSKAAGFAKSSIAKANALPPEQMKKMVSEKISHAKDEPRDMAHIVKDFGKSAGKGVAALGLAAVSLPLMAAAVVANKALDNKVKRTGYEDLQKELIRLDGEIQKAEQEGDTDKKADLLIAKRAAEQAAVKLRYGIKNVVHGSGLR
jgi:hypothetical protein